MASNITAGASATFTTTNMKPAVNEQIDALKAQNDADNMGHLYHRAQLLPLSFSSAVSGVSVSSLFYKTAAHNAVRVCFAFNANMGSLTANLYAYASTADYGNYGAADPAAASSSLTQTFNADTAYSLELNISALTNGNLYYIHFTSGANTRPPGVFLIHSTGATY